VGEAPLLPEPVVAAAGEFLQAVLGEELRGHAAQRGLLGDRLGAVLAELGTVPVFRFGPGAAGAVEALLLIDPEQSEQAQADSHLGVRMMQ
jgi:hypothetical protein